jgi:hypothetical protein
MMGTLTRDLITGEATHAFDLATLPFRTRLGPPRGSFTLRAGASGKLTGARVALVAPTRFVAGHEEWLASRADWDLKAARIGAAASGWLEVTFQLRPEHLGHLAGGTIEGPTFNLTAAAFERLMDEECYAVADVRGRG